MRKQNMLDLPSYWKKF